MSRLGLRVGQGARPTPEATDPSHGLVSDAGAIAGVPAARPRLLRRLRELVADSGWGPIVARGGGWAGAFVALTLVGSNALSGVLGPLGPPDETARAGLLSAGVGSEVASTTAVADAMADGGAGAPDAAGTDEAKTGAGDASAPEADASAAAPDAGPSGAITPDGRVVLNLAGEDDLRRLPGIGPTRARAILALRARLGRFRRPEDLLQVRGLGRRSFARLRPLVVVDPPGP